MNIITTVQDEVAETFDSLDENGDRRVSFEEFVALRQQMDHTRTRTALRREFDTIDRNRDGHVSFEEFRAWISPHERKTS